MGEKKNLIVGIDPGTTVGIAILGIEGEVLGIRSLRTCSIDDVTNLIMDHGYPLVIASDVSPIPSFVEKICHLFEAVPFVPNRSLTVEEKREIASQYAEESNQGPAFNNSHEKDAFAAAVKALDNYEEKFRWIDKKLQDRGLSEISEQVKARVVSGTSLSESLARELGKEGPSPTSRQDSQGAERSQPSEVNESKLQRAHRIEDSMIKNMKQEILDLKTKIKERELKIRSLGNELEEARSKGFWKIVRSKEVNSRNEMIKEMKRSLSRVAEDRNRLRRKLSSFSSSSLNRVADRIQAIPITDDLSKNTFRELTESIPDEEIPFIMVDDASGAGGSISDLLRGTGTKAVFMKGNLPAQARQSLEEAKIVAIPSQQLNYLRVGSTAVAKKQELERIIKRKRSELSKKQAKKAAEGLEKIVAGYRRKIDT